MLLECHQLQETSLSILFEGSPAGENKLFYETMNLYKQSEKKSSAHQKFRRKPITKTYQTVDKSDKPPSGRPRLVSFRNSGRSRGVLKKFQHVNERDYGKTRKQLKY